MSCPDHDNRSGLQRVAYIHVGTHKTGTTSIQAMLAANDAALAQAGILVPQIGRIASHLAGHHNLAWQLNNRYQFVAERGTLEEAYEEMSRANLPTVCVSSEEFEFLAADESKVRALFDGFNAIGYDPRIVLYIRPQADYIESLYAEIVKRWNVDFDDFLATILADGIFGESHYEYERIIAGFERIFGRHRMRVRLYRSSAPSVELLKEFLGLLADDGRHTIAYESFRWPERLNARSASDEVIAARQQSLESWSWNRSRVSSRRARLEAFAPLSLLDLASIALRFWISNDRVRRQYGVRVGSVTGSTLVREILTALGVDAMPRGMPTNASEDIKRLSPLLRSAIVRPGAR